MKQDITNLIESCLTYFKSNFYSSNRILTYESLWRNGILQYMKGNDLTVYTPEIGLLFINSITDNGLYNSHVRDKIRAVYVLDDILLLGYVRTRRTIPVDHPLLGDIGTQMQKHIEHLQSLRRSSITINRYKVYMHRLLIYLNQHGVSDINQISEHHVWGFLSSSGTNNKHVVSTLRVLFNYWHDEKITNKNFSDYLQFFKSRQSEPIPSFYSQHEVIAMERSIERTGMLGKRNYALFLLASRLGLRASDIAGLKFSNIDWVANEIRLKQYKTGQPISLPLLNDVGNAIIDYLRYGRPNSLSQNIFLQCRPPYRETTSRTVSATLSRIIISSGINIKERHHGSHSLRHSLASCLLEQSVSIPVISEILGHSSSETTMDYLKIDISSLMKCALSVPSVSNDFYTQKGGILYE